MTLKDILTKIAIVAGALVIANIIFVVISLLMFAVVDPTISTTEIISEEIIILE